MCELPLEAVVVDVDVVARSIWAVGVARSSILALTRLSVRLFCGSVRVGSSFAAGDGVREKL